MDVLVYSNIKDVYVNTDTLLATKTLSTTTDLDKIRWACKLDYIHCGNVIADVFDLNKTVLGKCPTYWHICNDSNAVGEIIKVTLLYDAIKDDINTNINTLDILQNNPSVAVGYLQQDWFLDKVSRDVACIRELVKNQSYCNAAATKINNYRANIKRALEGANIPYNDAGLGSGSGTFTAGVNTNSLMMTWSCHDDNDTDYSVYHGTGSHRVVYIPRHSGTVAVDHYVSLRGIKLVGSGSSIGSISYRHYNL